MSVTTADAVKCVLPIQVYSKSPYLINNSRLAYYPNIRPNRQPTPDGCTCINGVLVTMSSTAPAVINRYTARECQVCNLHVCMDFINLTHADVSHSIGAFIEPVICANGLAIAQSFHIQITVSSSEGHACRFNS